MKANPTKAVDPVQVFQEPGQAVHVPEIPPVMAGVLGDQVQLPYASSGEAAGFGDQIRPPRNEGMAQKEQV